MPKAKNIQKSLQEYLSKIKKQAPHLHFSHSNLSSTTSKIFSGCKHPKSLSFSVENSNDGSEDHNDLCHNKDAAATLEDIDRFLIENFKSLYGQDDEQPDSHETKRKSKEKQKTREYHQGGPTTPDNNSTPLRRGVLYDSPRFFTPPRDLCGSNRFFVSPASSGSLLEEAGTSGTGTSDDVGSTSTCMRNNGPHRIPGGIEDCIAVLTVSPSPYEDFRRSMQEIVEARVHHNQGVDWDFMEELLFCYLRLNEKKQYRYILSAFVDSVVTLRQDSSNRGPEGSRSSDGENNISWRGKGRGD